MKTLLILRHAKAAGESPSGDDRDRPLTDRGAKDAKAMGKSLRKLDVVPDVILSSTAARARQTAEIVAAHCRFAGTIDLRDDFYAARTSTLVAAVAAQADAARVLLVGHNPELESLVNQLINAPSGGVHLRTATLALVDFQFDSWSELSDGSGTLAWLLDPEVVEKL